MIQVKDFDSEYDLNLFLEKADKAIKFKSLNYSEMDRPLGYQITYLLAFESNFSLSELEKKIEWSKR